MYAPIKTRTGIGTLTINRSILSHVSGHMAKVAPKRSQANNANAWMLSLVAALITPRATDSAEFAVSCKLHWSARACADILLCCAMYLVVTTRRLREGNSAR